MGEYNTIADADLDTDSPYDTDVASDMRENVNYNHDHAVRCGTDDAGVRLACARGLTSRWDEVGAAQNFTKTGTVTYSGADDGDPNFDSVPVVIPMCIESGAGDTWNAASGISRWSITIHTSTATGFEWRIQFHNDNSGPDISGYFGWLALGPVTSGE